MGVGVGVGRCVHVCLSVCVCMCVCVRAQEHYIFIKIHIDRLSSFPSTRLPVCVRERKKCVCRCVCM